MMKTLVFVAAAAMGLTACQNDFEEQIEAKDSVVVTFVTDSADSRTSVDTSDSTAPKFAWDENETFAVLEQTDALAEATAVTYENVDGKAEITATFDKNAGKESYQYVTVYPATGYVSAEGIEAATLSIPAEQTMAEGSYDPDADLMVSEVVTTTAQPTEAQMVRFTRLAAVAKMTLTNFGVELGDQVQSVTFTADGKTIAGKFTTDLAAPVAENVEGGSSVVVTTTSSSDIYFTLVPTTIAVGESFSVTIVTDKRLYVRKVTIAEGKKPLTFEAGNVTRFSVNMQDVAPSDKWVLVRNVSDLEAGDIVTFVANNYNVVLGAKFSSTSYPYGSQIDIVKIGEYFYHPITTADTEVKNMVQQLVVAKQDEQYCFYNGVDYSDDENIGFACVKSTSYFYLQDAISENSLFDVSIDAETAVATVKATNSTVTAKYVYYYPHNSLTTRSFRGKSSAPTADQYMCIYKIEGAKGVIDASISLPENSLVVAGKEASNAVVADEVKFNYTDNWDISVSEEADWLEVNYADGKLTYTTQANENIGTRKAVVTIKATCNGAENTWEFTMLQKGEPQPISVADFIALKYDSENVENLYYDYSVTGALSTIASSHSGSTYLADPQNADTKATFKYIYLTDGNTTFYNNKGDVKTGDIVTIVASLTASKIGGSIDYPATYMGYYNLSATAENDLVAHTGGEVKVTIEKTGTLTPQTIKGSVSDNFATLDYTDNATEATIKLAANDGAPRQVVATFTDGYATASVTVVQAADTSKGNTWELVTDANTLEVGDQVIIAAKDYDVAMSTTINSDDRRDEVAVTKLGNHFITPTEGTQTFVLGAGSEANTFAFYDAVNEGYLVSTSTSYYLKNQAYVDANTSFAISIVDGSATISNTAGDYSGNKLYYYQSKQYFYSGTSEKEAISLYRLVGVKGIIPVTPADVTVPEKHVVVVEQGVTEPTAISEVVFNYVGDWNITATSDVEWLTSLNYDKTNNCLNYTAAANEGVVRYANVTIKASLEGQKDITWTFKVLQKGKPEEISIAEFITKPVDVNVEYKITGRVTVKSTTESGYYTLADDKGNTAEVRYVYTEDNAILAKQDIVKEGDVMTVTTVVTTSQKKGGSYAYHSIYKGHYRLTATVEPTVVGYEGGDATISVALTQNGTLGTLCAPTAIEGNMPASDFATFSYTTDAPTATVTFATNTGASRKVEATFKSGLAEATVVVGQQNDPSVKVGWFLVKDVNELKEGDKVIIAAKNPDETLNYAISSKSSTSGFRPSIAISVTGESIDDVTGVQQYTLLSGHADYAGTWAFKGDSDSKYLYVTSGSLKVTSTLDKNGSWTVEIDSDGKVTLTSKTTSTSNTMMLNWTSSNQTFSVYKPTQTGKGAIYIYKYYNSLEQ